MGVGGNCVVLISKYSKHASRKLDSISHNCRIIPNTKRPSVSYRKHMHNTKIPAS